MTDATGGTGSDRPQPPGRATFVIELRLAPAFAEQLAHAGVVETIANAAREGRTPDVASLVALGQPQAFARLFVERLAYLVRLKQAGILRAAGPYAGLAAGMYLCEAPDEAAARRVIEDDPLYRAGFIEPGYELHRWLVAI